MTKRRKFLYISDGTARRVGRPHDFREAGQTMRKTPKGNLVMWKRILLLFLLAALATALLSAQPRRAVPAQGVAEIAADASAPKFIAFTFDDGPHRGSTERLLDGLAERGAKGTFFLVGQEIDEGRDLVRRMRDEGHQIGNHTWSHRRLDELSDDEALQEIGKTDALLKSIAGEGEYWLRPPYGFLREGAEKLVGVPIVKWSVDPRDWESRDTEKVVEAVLADIEPGAIVLLHDIYPTSVEAALRLIDALSADGYQFVTVEELLRQSGVTPTPGESYRSATA